MPHSNAIHQRIKSYAVFHQELPVARYGAKPDAMHRTFARLRLALAEWNAVSLLAVPCVQPMDQGRIVGNWSALNQNGTTAEGDGYLLMLAYDVPMNFSVLPAFQALEVDRGPIAKAKLPARACSLNHRRCHAFGREFRRDIQGPW